MKLDPKFGLASVFAGLIFLLSAVIIFTSAMTSRQALLGHARDIMTNIASYTIDKSESHLIPARDAARLTRGLANSRILDNQNIDELESYFYEQMAIYAQFSAIYFGTTEGDFIMASRYNKRDPAGFFTKIISNKDNDRTVHLAWKDSTGRVTEKSRDPLDNYDPRQRPWFGQAVREQRLIWTNPYVFFTSQKPGITTATPVYDKNGRLKGVIGVDIEIDELSNFIARLKIGKNGVAFILNRNGDVIAFPDLGKIRHTAQDTGKLRLVRISELDDPVSRKAYESLGPGGGTMVSSEVFTTFTHQGDTYHAMFAPFKNPQWPWALGIYLPEDDYLADVKQVQFINICTALAAMVLASLIGLSVARALARARDAAKEADRTKSQFLTKMSHEIRTPMNAILGMADILWETQLTREQRNYARTLRSSGELLLDLINDVLDISKIESGRLELEDIEFDPREVLYGVSRVLCVPAHRKNLELVCRVSPTVPAVVTGDPTRLRQVLVNLVGNAVKFTHEGEIVIGLDSMPDDPKSGASLLISVSDTGIGIPTDKIDAIYEPFAQVDTTITREYGGTGLGLTISRRLVEMMDGRLWVERGPERGTVFHFTIRVGRATPPSGYGNMPEHLRGLRVLVVDDNDVALESTAELLTGWAMRTDTAHNSPEALSLIAKAADAKRPYDVVVLDHPLPLPDGDSLPQEIRRHYPSLRVVLMLTTYSHAQETQPPETLSDAMLTKPPHPQDLSRSILDSLDYRGNEEPEQGPSLREPHETPRDLNILLAEDSRSNAELIRLYLKDTGNNLEVAENGLEAVEKAETGRFDLILMDMQMPIMDGYEATRRIREMERQRGQMRTVIVAATAMSMAEEQRRCMEAGCDEYIAKPFKKREVLDLIARTAFGDQIAKP